MDLTGLQNLYDMANKEELNGKYLDAARMYAQLTEMISKMNNTEAADVYLQAAAGIARCANKDKQYDKAIDILENQLEASADSPGYIRNTLAYSYICKSARCCSSFYNGGVGMPHGKQETDNMESWIVAAENINPVSDEVTGLLSQSRWAIDEARKRKFKINNPVLFVFSILTALSGLFLYIVSISPELQKSIAGFGGESSGALRNILTAIIAAAETVPVFGSISYFLYIAIWFFSGIVLYIAGSFSKVYNSYGTPLLGKGFLIGLFKLLIFPLFSLIRLLKSLKK